MMWPRTDKTLAATKETVRKKLDLAPEVKLQFVQLRDGKKIDLDDGEPWLEVLPLRSLHCAVVDQTTTSLRSVPLLGLMPLSMSKLMFSIHQRTHQW